ncbi:MAG: hypothetical protein LBB23_01795 [Rickettsiales bacterium]|nr:hypothetical protein [Rickettsiales bacterium]
MPSPETFGGRATEVSSSPGKAGRGFLTTLAAAPPPRHHWRGIFYHYPAAPRHPFASEGDFCAINKYQPPRPPTLCYGATPLHLEGEFILSRRRRPFISPIPAFAGMTKEKQRGITPTPNPAPQEGME